LRFLKKFFLKPSLIFLFDQKDPTLFKHIYIFVAMFYIQSLPIIQRLIFLAFFVCSFAHGGHQAETPGKLKTIKPYCLKVTDNF